MKIQISAETLSPITHNQILVITTELLARLYGSTAHSITKNHHSNVDRFIAGKHYFKIVGQELAILRVTFGDLQISSKTRSLILWTERGAARHAKMLETDQAWEVFERLEDCYFRKISTVVAPVELQQQDNYDQSLLIQGTAITQLNALFKCAEHLRSDMWPHLVSLLPGLNRDYKLTFETLAMASALLRKTREECSVKAEKIMSHRTAPRSN